MNKSHSKLIAIISKVENEGCSIGDEDVASDDNRGIGEGKLRIACHN